jgi:hypothetical protein
MSQLQISFGPAALSRGTGRGSGGGCACPAGEPGRGVQHPVKAALRTNIQTTVCQARHDVPRRQRSKFRLVAGAQDPLAFHVAETVSHVPAAAFATVNAITVTNKLPSPALQRGEPHVEQQRQLAGSGTIAMPASRISRAFRRTSGNVNRPGPLPRRPESFLRRSAVLPPRPGLSPCGAAPA